MTTAANSAHAERFQSPVPDCPPPGVVDRTTDYAAYLSPGHAALSSGHAALSSGHAALSSGHAALSSGHAALSPRHAALSSGHAALSSGHAALSSGHAALSSGHAALSPRHAALSPGHAALSSGHAALSSGHAALSPRHAALSPGHAALSSHRSAATMTSLFGGIILGLLVVVHSAPLDPVTQDDVYREAVTDGYLVDQRFLTLLTTKSPEANAAVPGSPLLSSAIIEGSGSGDDPVTSLLPQDGIQLHTTTSWSVSHARSSFSTRLPPNDKDESGSGGSGSGHDPEHELRLVYPPSSWMPPAFTTETGPPAAASTADRFTKRSPSLFEEKEGSGSGSGSIKAQSKMFGLPDAIVAVPEKVETPDEVTPPNRTQRSTPGWIIIVAFGVCLAALVMLCVAIATRDKWNRPNQPAKLQPKADQQRALEKETFLLRDRDRPTENGKAGEYTVIPLEELPDKYSCH
ncbi:uncharacterized protein cd44a [Brachionichthys hirsutus]|uniref:uncharacterized protein cd44a n=1 Tax=Brachionichthys hirsutus TaxID=412623 RepID=UPI003604B652